MIFATLLGFYLLWRAGEWALDRLIYQNKAFAIQQIEVQTDGVIAVDQLRRWAGVKPGENLLALDLARVKRDLEMVSADPLRGRGTDDAAHVAVARHGARAAGANFRAAVAGRAAPMDMAILQLDEEGYVMTPLDPRQRATPRRRARTSLPDIRGINPNEIIPGTRMDSPQVRAALRLISRL